MSASRPHDAVMITELAVEHGVMRQGGRPMTASIRNDADPWAWRHARGKWFAAVGWMSGRRRIGTRGVQFDTF